MAKVNGREIQFAGTTWYAQTGQAGPQLNNWSDSRENVMVDDRGYLHLRILKDKQATWYSSEIKSQDTFGYGEYTFYVSSQIDLFDPYVVIGMFSWSADINEIDVEITSNFKDPQTEPDPKLRRLYHTVHLPKSLDVPKSYDLSYPNYDSNLGRETTHKFIWEPGKVTWQAYYGHMPSPSSLIKGMETCYDKTSQPIPGNSHLLINFWLVNPGYATTEKPPKGPLNGQGAELVIRNAMFPKGS
ncbi:MAG: glycoside hydrolase family 16 protein [Isosphaeraceae bacterium]